jgi:hypothetical protein
MCLNNMEGPEIEEWKIDMGKWFDSLNPNFDDRIGVWNTFEDRIPHTIRRLTKGNYGQGRTPETGNDLATHRQICLELQETSTTSRVQPYQPRNNALLHGRTTKISTHRCPQITNPHYLPSIESKSSGRSTIQSPDQHTQSNQSQWPDHQMKHKLVPAKEPTTTATTKEPTKL